MSPGPKRKRLTMMRGDHPPHLIHGSATPNLLGTSRLYVWPAHGQGQARRRQNAHTPETLLSKNHTTRNHQHQPSVNTKAVGTSTHTHTLGGGEPGGARRKSARHARETTASTASATAHAPPPPPPPPPTPRATRCRPRSPFLPHPLQPRGRGASAQRCAAFARAVRHPRARASTCTHTHRGARPSCHPVRTQRLSRRSSPRAARRGAQRRRAPRMRACLAPAPQLLARLAVTHARSAHGTRARQSRSTSPTKGSRVSVPSKPGVSTKVAAGPRNSARQQHQQQSVKKASPAAQAPAPLCVPLAPVPTVPLIPPWDLGKPARQPAPPVRPASGRPQGPARLSPRSHRRSSTTSPHESQSCEPSKPHDEKTNQKETWTFSAPRPNSSRRRGCCSHVVRARPQRRRGSAAGGGAGAARRIAPQPSPLRNPSPRGPLPSTPAAEGGSNSKAR